MHAKKGKAIPVTSGRGPWSCETSSVPHFLDNRLTDGGEAVSLTRRPSFNRRTIPGTNFYERLRPLQGHGAAGRIR
jgi:hypothetical protein